MNKKPSRRLGRLRKRIRLGVNIDHAATLRQVRGGLTPYPSLLQMARLSVAGGADQITIHLREDRRHIQENDLMVLTRKRPTKINLEMAATPEMQRMALKYKPNWVCFVPEKRAELTTEGGLNVIRSARVLKKMIQRLQQAGIKVSMFIDADIQQVQGSADLGAEAVEFHTGSWVEAAQHGRRNLERSRWQRLVAAAERAHNLGLAVHAGHGLDFETSRKVRRLPHLEEVNIGHFLICHSLQDGLESSVRQMKSILRQK